MPDDYAYLSIPCSGLAKSPLPDDALAKAARLLRLDGLVVLEQLIPVEIVAKLREAMLADSATLRERGTTPFNFVWGHAQQDPPPTADLLFPEVLVNPAVFQVTSAVLGPEVRNAVYTGNVNLPGSGLQPVHTDELYLFGDGVGHPTYCICVDIPLIDFTLANGSTEYWLGTHCINGLEWYDKRGVVDMTAVERRREERPPVRFGIPAGSAVIRDGLLWHRGVPNNSDMPRPMVAMTHYRSWFDTPRIELPLAVRPWLENAAYRTHATYVDGDISYLKSVHPFATA